MNTPKLSESKRAELLAATPPLRICTNRHPECSGLPWGWVEDARSQHIAFWSGERPAEREAIVKFVAELNDKYIAAKTKDSIMSNPIPGRAETYEQKRAIMEKVLAIWTQYPKLRLGQLIQDAVDVRGANVFYVEDEKLVELLNAFVKAFPPVT